MSKKKKLKKKIANLQANLREANNDIYILVCKPNSLEAVAIREKTKFEWDGKLAYVQYLRNLVSNNK